MTTIPTMGSEALTDRLVAAMLGTCELAALSLGARLGWYRDLADGGWLTAAELAGRSGTDARYAREWVEHQAVSGYLAVDDVRAEPEDRRYSLPPEHRGVLVDELDPAHLTPFARLVTALTGRVPELAEVYRGRRTLSWADLGDEVRDGQAAANRPFFLGRLVEDLLPAVPGVDAALSAGGRVADVGCGYGWSSIGIANRWPDARVDGFDVDVPSVERARANAAGAGVASRTCFRAGDVAALIGDGDPDGEFSLDRSYDLVTAFECVHDLPDPVRVLAAMRRMVRPGGTVLVMDEAVAEQFTVPGSDVDRLMYGFSLLCCLPDGRSTEPSVATGTVMRPATLRRYAQEAGFADAEILPLEADLFRFYRLVPA
jgi:SAM-dependent methyltransferase